MRYMCCYSYIDIYSYEENCFDSHAGKFNFACYVDLYNSDICS